MNAELIHIECGVFNGIANYRIGDKILRFELGTPSYNDYGEYRVSTEFEPIEFHEKYVGYKPTNLETNIELFDNQVDWWFNEDSVILPYMEENQVVGGRGKDEEFVIFDKNRKVVKFSYWEKEEHDPYEHFMFNVLNVFYHWFQSDDCKPTRGLSIFPKL